MKKLMFIMAFTLAAAGVNAQFTAARLQATGLTCAMCTNAIHKALEKLPFVSSVEADISNSAFDIRFREGESFQLDELKKAVEDAGFSVGILKLQGNFQGIVPGSNGHFRWAGMNFHLLDHGSRTLKEGQWIKVVDRDYLTSKSYRKLSHSVKHACYAEGKATDCCVKEGITAGERLYHVMVEN